MCTRISLCKSCACAVLNFLEDVKERISEFLDFLKNNYDGKHVAIVAHKAPQLTLEHLIQGKTWKQAFAEDWRKKKAWQPGWEYVLE